MNTDYPIAHELFAELWSSLGSDEVWLDRVRFHGDGAGPRAVRGSRLLERFQSGQASSLPGGDRGQSALLGAPRGVCRRFEPRMGHPLGVQP
jgi:hypothetical protein